MLTKDSWRSLLKEYEESDLNRLQFCKFRSISYSQFHYYWRKNVQKTIADIPVLKSLVIHLPNQIRCEIREEISSKNLAGILQQLVQLC